MRNLLLRSLPPLLAFLVISSRAAAQGAGSPLPPDQIILSPGDSVRIVVWRKPEMSGDFIVGPDGTITHPLYQAVRVGAIPFSTAQTNVRAFLGRFEQDPQFVIEPLIRIAISGEVGRPQVMAVRPETTIGEAVAQAGGPNQFANRGHVRILRREGTGQAQREFYVDLSEPSKANLSLRVHSGDQIVVDRRRSFFRDVFLPGLSVVGSIASIYLLVDRANRNP